ncbi:MAG: FliO/MopB family protein [Micavibrio aeruginosavorus]|uniref:FliO/MopB family protein n=1 Tax=Micavibrio aeruginosavorus TaxID=349221 RepID=A0A7T5UGZ2_9BACT|nr:MAG: FliO/MopB family protein [Micavibrio aeruginosavorus]
MELLDTHQLMKFIAALLFVLSLMGLLALAMRRINNGGTVMPLARRRLKVVETLPLDPRRKLAIVRCDNREHLLILGTNTETVIESGLKAPQDSGNIIKIEKSA